jgi:KUP system potassium uptake protein
MAVSDGSEALPSRPSPSAGHRTNVSTAALTLGALGVVFGDIGTSPLYTLRECLHATGRATAGDVYGLLSLIFWSLTMVVTVKYLTFIMRADNHGEGGIFALLALVPDTLRTQSRRRISGVAIIVVVGAALLYGDGAITPAISVLSAMEGISVFSPQLEPAIIPLTCGILIALFLVQKRGTGAVGALFGPVMVVWFSTLGILGAWQIAQHPQILGALAPHHAVRFFLDHGVKGFLVLGAVVLAVTGGEALYADMGHFGKAPIRIAWLAVAMPALVVNYFGQGALVLTAPQAPAHPFFALVPRGAATIALVVLSTAATIIASQALISGAFSLTRQAMLLGYFPRVSIRHTAAHTEGQIYIPQINWLLAVGCLLLVLGFHKSERLAAAYGIAVTGTMVLTSLVYFVVTKYTWHWPSLLSAALLAVFLVFDVPFFLANLTKILDGGWVPVFIGIAFIAAMLVWSKGRALIVEEYMRRSPTVEEARDALLPKVYTRVPGVGVFMSSSMTHVPPIIVHLIERQRVLPEHVVLVTVLTKPTPEVLEAERLTLTDLGHGIHRAIITYGFMQQPHVPLVMQEVLAHLKLQVDPSAITYYLGRENVLGSDSGAMGRWAEGLFGYLQRNAVAADEHFSIPRRQVIEVGLQLDL